jgi:hypothetical protein
MLRDNRGKAVVVGSALLVAGIGVLLTGLSLGGCNSSNNSGNGIVTKRKESTASAPSKAVEPVTTEEAEAAKKQLELAIRAHGGDNNLVRMRNYFIFRQSGKSDVSDAPRQPYLPTEREWQIAFPDRVYVTVTLANQAPSYEWCNDSGGWLRLGAGNEQLAGDMLEDLRTQLYIFSLFTLRPLREPEFVLKPLPDTNVQGKPAKAIKVMQKDHHQIELDFDAQTNLLVRISLRRKLPQVDSLIDHQILLSNHKAFEGVQLPTRWMEINDSRLVMDLDTAEYRFPADIPMKLFAKPE